MAGTCLKAEAQLANALQPMQYLEAQIRQLSAKHFGHSSQKTNKNQLSLFDDVFNKAEAKAEPFVKEPELITVPAHKRDRSKAKKAELLENILP